MTANLKKFLEFASNNEALKDRVTEINREHSAETKEEKIAGVIQAAKEFGYELKIEDFAMAQTTGELSDDELEAVTGGNCGCWFGGGGSGLDSNCVCVFTGSGMDNGRQACDCVIVGMGVEQ